MKKQHFPQIAEACKSAVQDYIHHFLKHSDPFISQLPEYPIYEGFETHIVHMGGREIGDDTNIHQDLDTSISELKEASGSGIIKKQDIESVNISAFRNMLNDVGDGLNRERGRTLFAQLNADLEQAGRVTDFEGKPFSFEIWLQTLENIEFTFDEHGNPNYPTLVIPPAMKPAVDKVLQDAEGDPEKIKAFQDLVIRKREAFNAKETHRKLVD